MAEEQVIRRRYRILSLLGTGGFGRVYHARLEGPVGFSKEVAIKLLHDGTTSVEILKRFRDEARIMGLIRDRAVVSVDPPTRLGGKWAVIMDYVDGMSAQELLRSGLIPPGVAVEIVQEIARCLDNVWSHPGPDGQPLEIAHRDLKPANIQITPSGEVKVLDFGIARARFATREAETSHHIAGTVGYIAPERFEGADHEKSDVFSLGVFLWQLVSGGRDLPKTPPDSQDPLHPIYLLVLTMREHDPELRATAHEVSARCRALRASFDRPFLSDWARREVHRHREQTDDALVGSLLTEQVSMTREVMPTFPQAVVGTAILAKEKPQRRRWVWLSLLFFGLTGAAAVIAGGMIAVQQGWIELGRAPIPVPITPEPAPGPPPEVAPLPLPITEPGPSPDPEPQVAPKPRPTSIPRPERTVKPIPEPMPDPPPAVVTPEPVLPTFPVTISSDRLGAEVWIDGVSVGWTPLTNHPLTSGTHAVRMVTETGEATKEIVVSRRAPNHYLWRGAESRWVTGFQ